MNAAIRSRIVACLNVYLLGFSDPLNSRSLALSLRRELGNKIVANPFHYLFVADAP